MLKLIKYEMRKQLFSKIFLLCILGLLELLFLYGIVFEHEQSLAISMGLFVFVTMGTLVFVSIESILTYSNDLKTKQSYMIFLTPNSMFKVVGAKIMSTVITISLTAVAFIAIIVVDVGIVLIRYNEIAKAVDIIKEFMLQLFGTDINYTFVILVVFSLVIQIIRIVIIGMASITLSATFLSNSKVKGLVSVALFFAITWALSKLGQLILPSFTAMNYSVFIQNLCYEVAIVAVFYFATVWMLDKKVSV